MPGMYADCGPRDVTRCTNIGSEETNVLHMGELYFYNANGAFGRRGHPYANKCENAFIAFQAFDRVRPKRAQKGLAQI